ncbi:chaperone (DUF3353) [Wolffia australiana]
MAAALTLNRAIILPNRIRSSSNPKSSVAGISDRLCWTTIRNQRRWGFSTRFTPPSRTYPGSRIVSSSAGFRADDSSTPSEMSLESALKLLGVAEGSSFDEILRAKNTTLAACKEDPEAVAKVEAAYDMLLMQSLMQRRAGKVVNSGIRYADVKPERASSTGSMPQWLQSTAKNPPVAVESPSSRSLGIQGGVYGALMVCTFVTGSSSTGPYTGADVPGLLLATGFGASLYFLSKKNIKLGKATLITAGGLVAGAVVGSAVEQWLQVDIVPFMGIRSPAVIVSEFILLSQFLFSLYLR